MQKIILAVGLWFLVSVAQALPLELHYSDGAGGSFVLQGATIDTNRYVYVPALSSSLVKLQWNKNIDKVDGYLVYFGNDITTPDEIRDVPNPTADVDVVTEFTIASLNLSVGQKGCFRLTAYNDVGRSGYSKAVCTTHTLITAITYSIDGVELANKTTDPKGFSFKIAGLSLGTHTMTAVITNSDSSQETRTAVFTISAQLPDTPQGVTVIKIYP